MNYTLQNLYNQTFILLPIERMKHTGDYELDRINMLEQECADLEEENKKLEKENKRLKEENKILKELIREYFDEDKKVKNMFTEEGILQ